jgi:hypothetical protein
MTKIPWWDEIAFSMRHASTPMIRLPGLPSELRWSGDETDDAVRRVLYSVKRRKLPMEEQVNEIRSQCRPKRQITPADGLFMTWGQIREMRAAGMSIGSHTHNHPVLSGIDIASQRDELATSKKILENELSAPIRCLAYPVGRVGTYSQDTCSIARETGYALGFTAIQRSDRLPLQSEFEIGRFTVDKNTTGAALKSSVAFPGI